ncbi:unnamed protein product [Linum tenue]|uniref:Uncharacterized protein n=1 Tax=Linum tenue TaxID=586396 RepID=A0AAV0N1H4_9ROSI|nr:unnamed protein product [Linum tenue]
MITEIGSRRTKAPVGTLGRVMMTAGGGDAGEGKGFELGRESASGSFWGKPGMFGGRDEIVHGIDCELGMTEEKLRVERGGGRGRIHDWGWGRFCGVTKEAEIFICCSDCGKVLNDRISLQLVLAERKKKNKKAGKVGSKDVPPPAEVDGVMTGDG